VDCWTTSLRAVNKRILQTHLRNRDAFLGTAVDADHTQKTFHRVWMPAVSLSHQLPAPLGLPGAWRDRENFGLYIESAEPHDGTFHATILHLLGIDHDS